LQQLLERAISQSPEIGETKNEIVEAQSDLHQAKAAYYPQLDLQALTGPVGNAKRPVIYNDTIHNAACGGIGIFGRLDFTITQPLYTFGKLDNREQAASQGVKAKEFELPKKKNEIVLRVKQLYYALVLARQGIKVANESDEFFDDARKRIDRLLRLKSPNVNESDLYMIDAYNAESKRFRAEAEKGEHVAYVALKYMINLPPGEDFDVPEKDIPGVEGKMGDQNSYIQKALAERPEIKQLGAALEAQKFQVDAAQSDRYPSFFTALEGSFAGAPGRERLINDYISDDFNHANTGIVGGLQWTFDFGILKARVDKEQAAYAKLLCTKTNAERSIPIEVAKAYQEVLQWQKAAEASEIAARASRKWIITAFSNFDMGVGTAKNIFDALEKYGQNRGDYLEALYNSNLSFAQLEFAVGKNEQ
jgi:outer membrane protein TolC